MADPREDGRSAAPTQTTESPFVVPPTENPITVGAQALREETRLLLEGSVFPKNGGYREPDANLVYTSIDPNSGTRTSYKLIILTPTSEYKTGHVPHYVGSDYSYYKFWEANFVPATDLEIVRNAPKLLSEYFDLVQREIADEDEPLHALTTTEQLSKRSGVMDRVREISRTVLTEMGEEVVEQDPEEVEREAAKRQQIEAHFTKIKAAMALYGQRHTIRNQLREAARAGRSGNVEEEISRLTDRIVKSGLFEVDNGRQIEGLDDTQFIPYVRDLQPLRHSEFIEHRHDGGYMTVGVTVSGKIVEVEIYKPGKPTRRCAEHIVDDAENIGKGLIANAVAQVLPNLKWDPFGPDFSVE